jgi:hypothetical protein
MCPNGFKYDRNLQMWKCVAIGTAKRIWDTVCSQVGILLLQIVIFGSAFGAFAQSSQPMLPAAVVLVRHAEKSAVQTDDPELTAAGTRRAEDLATALSGTGVSANITTQFLRTRKTAEPLAARLGLIPETVPVLTEDLETRIRTTASERPQPSAATQVRWYSLLAMITQFQQLLPRSGGQACPIYANTVWQHVCARSKNNKLVRHHTTTLRGCGNGS